MTTPLLLVVSVQLHLGKCLQIAVSQLVLTSLLLAIPIEKLKKKIEGEKYLN